MFMLDCTRAMFKARVRRDPSLPTCGLQYKAQIKVALWPLKWKMNNVAILPARLNRPIYHRALQINSIHQLFVSSGLLMRRDIAQGSLIINVWMQPEPDTRAGELKHYSLSCALSPPTCPSQQHSHYSNEATEAPQRQGRVEEVERWERTEHKGRNVGVETFQQSLKLTLDTLENQYCIHLS